jgi:hypothetical protein
MRTLLLALAVTALAAAAHAADLNAPVRPVQPTIGSEIKRGADAAVTCDEAVNSTSRPERFADCVDAAAAANRQRMGSGYEAFDAGLYFIARKYLAIVLPAGSATVQAADAGYRSACRSIGATDAEVERAAFKRQ